VGVKRLLLIAVFVLSASVVLVPGASAGDIADAPCPDAGGPNTATCPPGRQGEPYGLRFLLKEGSGCSPGDDSWSVTSGSFPPGLTLASEGIVSGTPTQAGNFTFFIRVSYPTYPGCNGGWSDKQVTIPIQPEIPRLILQPEQSAVPISTVGAAFSLQMMSNLTDAKTWTLASGSLPTGVNLDAASGLISGTPTTAGTFSFTVSAVLTNDTLKNPPRSDTKALAIVVRPAVVITAGEPFAAGSITKWEVGVPFDATLAATGGNETYTWALAAGSALPTGLALGTDGTISGTPRAAGLSRFAVTATDGEGRVATYRGTLNVAAKIAVVRKPLPAGKVGKRYKARLRTTGGVAPVSWRITSGPLPRGVKLNRTTGVLAGKPTKAGRYRITAEATDELGVKSARSFTIVVRAAPAKKKR
jgi:large repetitive protein